MTAIAKAFLAHANASQYYDENDPLTHVYANLVAMYSNDSQFKGTVRGNAAGIEACLRAKQVLYWKNTPGDCGTGTQISASALQQGAKTGLLAAGTLTSLASAGVFGGAAGSSGIAAEVSSVAVSGAFAAATAGIGLALVPVFAIIAHHKAAVAKEQGTLCEVTTFVNNGFAAVRDANVDWKTKQQYFKQIAQQALDGAAIVTQKHTGTCNAGCMVGNTILAMRDLYILLYAQPPSSQVLDGVGSLTTTQQGGPTATNSQGGAVIGTLGKDVVVAGAGAWIAHGIGAF